MIQPAKRGSLTDFAQNATEAVKRLKETGQPQVLTVDGRAEAVVLDVESYQRLWELADRADAVEKIREALASIGREAGVPHDELYAQVRARLSQTSDV